MKRGRPTQDPKGTLLAVRLSARHLRVLQARARREAVTLSEALRRCVDDCAAPTARPRARQPTAEERQTFDEVFAALGLSPRPHPRRGSGHR